MSGSSSTQPGGHFSSPASVPCLPFFHPTRVVFVDDELGAVRRLAERVAPGSPVTFYESGGAVLQHLDEGRLETRIHMDCIEECAEALHDRDMEHILSLDKTMLMKRLFDPKRFSVVGVIVIDHSMPDMDGLALCRSLEKHASMLGYRPAKRIMLTGYADHELGIEALNDGLVSAFYRKDREDLAEVLRRQISVLQRDYIADATRGVRELLVQNDPVLSDLPEFSEWLENFRASGGFVEYYAVYAPGHGFLLLDEEAAPSLVLLFSAKEVDSQYQAALSARAPMDVLLNLKRYQHALYFPSEGSGQVLQPDQWRQSCVPIFPFPGRYDQFYALPSDARPHSLGLARVTPLRQALARD